MEAITVFAAAMCVVALSALLVARRLHRKNRQLSQANLLSSKETERLRGEVERVRGEATRVRAENARLTAPPPRKNAEEWEAERLRREVERLDKQLRDVSRESVKFYKDSVMNDGEVQLFYAALNITQQPNPGGQYPFYVFPQVSLGEIIRTNPTKASLKWQAGEAHRAINCKRCDLLVADMKGKPVALFEHQGGAHNLGGNAAIRDKIKRIAAEAAGIRLVEIEDRTSSGKMQHIIRSVLDEYLNEHQTGLFGPFRPDPTATR